MKGRKCSIIFMRKVQNRLADLEERYKDEKNKKKKAKLINDALLNEFCVRETELFNWKKALKVMENTSDICTIAPSHAMEIAKLPDIEVTD